MAETCDDSDFEYSFGDLRKYITPTPKRGRINVVLREHFFIKNDQAHWIRKNNVARFMTGTPSKPKWKLEVLPILVDLLNGSYDESYEIVLQSNLNGNI